MGATKVHSAGCNPVYQPLSGKYLYSCGLELRTNQYEPNCPNRDTCWHVHPELAREYEQKLQRTPFWQRFFREAI